MIQYFLRARLVEWLLGVPVPVEGLTFARFRMLKAPIGPLRAMLTSRCDLRSWPLFGIGRIGATDDFSNHVSRRSVLVSV